jgi:hypothetical protein
MEVSFPCSDSASIQSHATDTISWLESRGVSYVYRGQFDTANTPYGLCSYTINTATNAYTVAPKADLSYLFSTVVPEEVSTYVDADTLLSVGSDQLFVYFMRSQARGQSYSLEVDASELKVLQDALAAHKASDPTVFLCSVTSSRGCDIYLAAASVVVKYSYNLVTATLGRDKTFNWDSSQMVLGLVSLGSVPCAVLPLGQVQSLLDATKSIKTSTPTRHLAYSKNRIFAFYPDTQTVEIIGLSGDVSTTFTETARQTLYNLASGVIAVTSRNGRVYTLVKADGVTRLKCFPNSISDTPLTVDLVGSDFVLLTSPIGYVSTTYRTTFSSTTSKRTIREFQYRNLDASSDFKEGARSVSGSVPVLPAVLVSLILLYIFFINKEK